MTEVDWLAKAEDASNLGNYETAMALSLLSIAQDLRNLSELLHSLSSEDALQVATYDQGRLT